MKPVRVKRILSKPATMNDTPGFLAVVGTSVAAGVITTLIVQKFFSNRKKYLYE